MFPRELSLVIGIPRSGMIPAAHIATSMNLPLLTLSEFTNDLHLSKYNFTLRAFYKSNQNHILVVDDTTNTGQRMTSAIKLINSKFSNLQITTFSVCAALNSQFKPDILLEISRTPRIFAWNMFNHHELTQTLSVDLDGVLCLDPTPEQNDDGLAYNFFINHAKPEIAPMFPVAAVITGRLEKYRSSTERWLRNNHVEYGQLFMNDAPDAKFRQTKRYQLASLEFDQISEFKSRVISSIKSPFFVESNLNQAKNIHNLTGVPCYVFEDDVLFSS